MTYKDLPIVSETELIFARAQTRDWLHAVKKGGAGGGGGAGFSHWGLSSELRELGLLEAEACLPEGLYSNAQLSCKPR